MASRGRAPSRLPFLFLAAALVAAVAAGTALYLRVSGEESPVISQRAPYTEGVIGTWERVNPLYSSGNPVDEDLVQLVFAGLLRTGPDGAAQPGLANLPEIGEGGRTYTFHLRDGVTWHDGEPVDAGDVLFTIEQITAPGFAGDSSLASTWEEIEVSAPDDRTVVLRLPEPNAPFLVRQATLPILPEHRLEGLSPGELHEADFNSNPVGAGPYRVSALSDGEAVLTAFEGYHQGAPALDEIRLRFFSDLPSSMRAIEQGEIDGLMLESIPSDEVQARIDELDGVTSRTVTRTAYMTLYLNNDAAQFFQDERVRRAISLAIDREPIVDEYLDGYATASSSPVAPGSWAYDPGYDRLETDLDAARALLDAAGWEQRPTSPVRVRLGSEFRITIRTDNDPVRAAVAEEIAHQLEPLGIRANVATTSFNVLRRDYLQVRRYETALTGWEQGMDPDPYFGWHSSQMGSAGLNIANYSDAVADRLIEEARQQNDPAVRSDMYIQFQEIWQRNAPSVVIAYPGYVYLQRDTIEPSLPEIAGARSHRFIDIHLWRRS